MRQRDQKQVPLDADLVVDPCEVTWDWLLEELDSLFASWGASPCGREILRLRVMGYSIEEIARRFGARESSVRRYLATAKQRLVDAELVPRSAVGALVPGATGRRGTFQVRGTKRPPAARRGGRLPHRTASTTTPGSSCSPPLPPEKTFGWRDVYYNEVHRYARKR